MSRSYRKNPIMGHGTGSEKWDKKCWHRRFRKKEKQALRNGDEIFPHCKEVSDPWEMQKDGKGYFGPWDEIKEYWKDSPEIYYQMKFK